MQGVTYIGISLIVAISIIILIILAGIFTTKAFTLLNGNLIDQDNKLKQGRTYLIWTSVSFWLALLLFILAVISVTGGGIFLNIFKKDEIYSYEDHVDNGIIIIIILTTLFLFIALVLCGRGAIIVVNSDIYDVDDNVKSSFNYSLAAIAVGGFALIISLIPFTLYQVNRIKFCC